MIEDVMERRGTLCEIYGHNWRATSAQGMYQCTNCRQQASCSGCLLTVPKGAQTMRCEQHKEQKKRPQES